LKQMICCCNKVQIIQTLYSWNNVIPHMDHTVFSLLSTAAQSESLI
jgi:uncharacterized protein involved in tolerance to divalent cations